MIHLSPLFTHCLCSFSLKSMTVPYLCLALMNLDPCVFVVICIIAVITTCKCVLHEKSVSLLVCFVFFQIGRIVENSEAVSEILNNVELLKQIVYCIGGENLSVAKVVSSLEHSQPTVQGMVS